MATERARLPDVAPAWPGDPLMPRTMVRGIERPPETLRTPHVELAVSATEVMTAPEILTAPEVRQAPVDADLMDVAADLAPGKALDLGCGEGHNSVWLAQQGWTVTGVDNSPSAVADARQAAAGAGVTAVFAAADLADWVPASRFDLVFSTYALPARGMGRSRMLEMAAAAVAPGGTILLTEFDISLRNEGWMAEKYLVSTVELERHLDGFRINRSTVRRARHQHGYDERILPVATVVATRRTDLRSL